MQVPFAGAHLRRRAQAVACFGEDAVGLLQVEVPPFVGGLRPAKENTKAEGWQGVLPVSTNPNQSMGT